MVGILLGAAPLRAQTPAAQNRPPDSTVAFSVTGGTWEAARSRGHFRLLVLKDHKQLPCLLLIEWIEVGTSGAVVRDTRLVSVITSPWRLERPEFVPDPRVVKATIKGRDEENGHESTWILTLGPPGLFAISPVRH